MRLRNIPGSREMIAESEYVVHEDMMRERRGLWNKDVFGRQAPLEIEIGTGKGQFITQMALRSPQTNYVGIEKYSSVLVRAVEKREQMEEVHNLYFLRMDAEDLCDVFAPGEVSVIYLNFSDPWPKERHAKRRLPGPEFLRRYKQILTGDGRVEFKTDNSDLFAFALESAAAEHWTLQAITWDLHADKEMNEGNIMTEYEERFSGKGNPIHKMIITP